MAAAKIITRWAIKPSSRVCCGCVTTSATAAHDTYYKLTRVTAAILSVAGNLPAKGKSGVFFCLYAIDEAVTVSDIIAVVRRLLDGPGAAIKITRVRYPYWYSAYRVDNHMDDEPIACRIYTALPYPHIKRGE